MCKNLKKNCQKPITPVTLVVTYWPQFYLCYDSGDSKIFIKVEKKNKALPPPPSLWIPGG